MTKDFKAPLCAFLLAGVALCANAGAPIPGSTAYIQKHKNAEQKHEAIVALLESRVPELTTGCLDATEWMFDHLKPTKAEKQQGKDFIAALNASSGLTKKEKARVRGFVNRSIGVWSGGKIAGVTIGSVVGLLLLASGIYKAVPVLKAGMNHCFGAGRGGSASGASATAPTSLFCLRLLNSNDTVSLTRENFAEPSRGPGTGSSQSLTGFLMAHRPLIPLLDAIRYVAVNGQPYYFCSVGKTLSVYAGNTPKPITELDYGDLMSTMTKDGPASQIDAILGQDAIQQFARDNQRHEEVLLI
jgi:hypothetical protein